MVTLEDMTRQDMINLRDELNDLIGEEKQTVELDYDKTITWTLSLQKRKQMFKDLYKGLNKELETDYANLEKYYQEMYNKKDWIWEVFKGKKYWSVSDIFEKLWDINDLKLKSLIERRPALKLLLKL